MKQNKIREIHKNVVQSCLVKAYWLVFNNSIEGVAEKSTDESIAEIFEFLGRYAHSADYPINGIVEMGKSSSANYLLKGKYMQEIDELKYVNPKAKAYPIGKLNELFLKGIETREKTNIAHELVSALTAPEVKQIRNAYSDSEYYRESFSKPQFQCSNCGGCNPLHEDYDPECMVISDHQEYCSSSEAVANEKVKVLTDKWLNKYHYFPRWLAHLAKYDL